MMKILKVSILALTLALFGCSFLRESPSTAKLVVQYSVAKFAEQSSAERRLERLNNVKRIASSVKTLAANESATIPLLKNIVLEQVAKLHLSPADTVLAQGLIDVIAEQLGKKIGEGLLKPEDKLLVADVMDWVIEAATLSGAA